MPPTVKRPDIKLQVQWESVLVCYTTPYQKDIFQNGNNWLHAEFWVRFDKNVVSRYQFSPVIALGTQRAISGYATEIATRTQSFIS